MGWNKLEGMIKVSGAIEDGANGWYEPNTLPKDFLSIIEDKSKRETWRQMLNVKTGKEETYPYNMSLKQWTSSFPNRRWYAGPNGYVMSYNPKSECWAILSPHFLAANHNHLQTVDYSQKKKSSGRAIYRVKTDASAPPTKGWKTHNKGKNAKGKFVELTLRLNPYT